MRLWQAILAVTVAVFAVQLAAPGIEGMLGLTATAALSGAFWQFVTYLFIHGDLLHIGFNMFAFLIFAPAVEEALGNRKFGALYFLSGIGSALLFIAITGIVDELLIGASGAVFGVLAAYGVLFPKHKILLYGVVPVPALLAVFGFAALEIVFGVTGAQPGIA
ncbi:MAG TPA: rhomboid family intramembrane serine protease, partial [archaeon]|nr:rhomboid family intramembrane serine protease [archaeon]